MTQRRNTSRFWIQVAASEVKRPLRNRFRSETAKKKYNGYMKRPFPNGQKRKTPV
jgi:hypothetical protein